MNGGKHLSEFKKLLSKELGQFDFEFNTEQTSMLKGQFEVKLVSQRFEGVEIWFGIKEKYPKIPLNFILELYLTGKVEVFHAHFISGQPTIELYREFLRNYWIRLYNEMPVLIENFYKWTEQNEKLINDGAKKLGYPIT